MKNRIKPQAKISKMSELSLYAYHCFFCDALIARFEETRVFNTICRATFERQDAVRELAKTVEAVVIVGDKKSANTKRLAAIAAEINPKSFMVESADQIDEKQFQGLSTVGITAGASTPDWIIAKVEARLSSI
jgi:4-hydroxy-3-methylbut-2-enyl diphosphate reductase